MQTRSVSALNEESRNEISASVAAAFGDEVSVEYDDSSGDRVYVRLPQANYDARAASVVNEDGSGVEGIALYSRLEEQFEEEIEAALAAAGFEETTADRFGNPTARTFAVRVQTLQAVVAAQFEIDFGDSFLEIDRVETVGPRVGAQLRNDAIRAILFALVGILLYISLRFDLRYAPGAVLALAHDVMITLGIFVIIQEEISLPILAALLTIVGYSLNDTIVNFDRIRENLELASSRNKLADIVNRSLNECLSRTVLTSMTTLLAVVCIYVLGGGLIRSFALAMIIGVIVGTYSSIFIASPVMVFTTKHLDAQAEVRKVTMAAAKEAS
jgi:preprotein translocase subunit SecF